MGRVIPPGMVCGSVTKACDAHYRCKCHCGSGKVHCFLTASCAFSSSESFAFLSAVPGSSLVLLAWRCTASVAHCSPFPEGAIVPATDQGRKLFPLWVSIVFLPFRSSSFVRVLGDERRTSTCAASRGPWPSGRAVPWNGPPPHMPGVARGAWIPPRKVDFPLVFQRF